MEDHRILGCIIIVSMSETTNSNGDFFALDNNNKETIIILITRKEGKKHDQLFLPGRPSVDNHHKELSS
jgi:hypothetical protein